VERLEALQPKETHVVKSSDGGDVYVAVTPKVDKPLSRELVEVEPVVVVLPGQQLTAELASDPAPVLVATGAGQPSEETETLAVNLQKGELENDIYFVIGSFRNHANALGFADEHQALLPFVLAANLRDRAIYRVVVGPVGGGQDKNILRSIWKSKISDIWKIRVSPRELNRGVGNAQNDWMNSAAINAQVKRLETLKSKISHVAKNTDYGGVFAAVSAWAQQEIAAFATVSNWAQQETSVLGSSD